MIICSKKEPMCTIFAVSNTDTNTHIIGTFPKKTSNLGKLLSIASRSTPETAKDKQCIKTKYDSNPFNFSHKSCQLRT